MEENRSESIKTLRAAVERSVGRPMRTPKDFDFLSERIFARINIHMSPTTLKRVWGYVAGGETRTSTLSHLASFLGYADWEDFLKANSDPDGTLQDAASGYLRGRHISVLEDLTSDDRLRLIWQPDRVCTVRYLGDARFEVEASEKTRLQPGDTFSCAIIMEGEPLYLDALRQAGREPTSYVCGSRSGIRFERIQTGAQ